MTLNLLAQATPTPSPEGIFGIITGPGWEFAGALIGLVALIAAILFFRAERQRKQLSYQVLVRTPLISIREEEELQGRLKILLDGQALYRPDLETVVVKITNTGNVPVDDEDFSGPMKLRFGDSAEILTSAIITTEPTPFEATVEVEPTAKRQVLLAPVLLNKGQSITIKTLVRQADKFSVYAHIKGAELKEHQERKMPRWNLEEFVLNAIIIFLPGFGLVLLISNLLRGTTHLLAIILNLFSGLIVLATFVLMFRSFRGRSRP